MTKIPQNKKVKYYLDKNGEFVIDNYNHAKPLANFFPGIAGKYGIPMWVFYVNRSQCICSFGVKDKDGAISEFFPANKSWQMVSRQGFRTFIKVSSGKKYSFYEPFCNCLSNLDFAIKNKMFVSSSGLALHEDNLTLGLQVNVNYFTVPDDSFAGLARIVTIQNNAKIAQKIEILDGIAQIMPYGMNNWLSKEMSRTIEAWMLVQNLDKYAPFYKLAVDPADKPEVTHINEGNFYLGFHFDRSHPRLLKPLVDPESIFGAVTDFSYPERFMNTKNFRYPAAELAKNKTPCGFILHDQVIRPGGTMVLYSIVGYMPDQDLLNRTVKRIIQPGYLQLKECENKKLISGLQQDIDTKSSSAEFDLYAKQTYLDNLMRGGYPITFQSDDKKSTFYAYARKHGDLERDYNKFHIQPSFLSQGNGNYRDVNQNRRIDPWFNPEVGDDNILTFFNLLQTDGFNPLVVKGVAFVLDDPKQAETILMNLVALDAVNPLVSFMAKPFTPGDLISFIQKNKVTLKSSYDELLGVILAKSRKIQEAEHGEGFWSDHWTYNLDLLESYFAIYPERLNELIFKKNIFVYFDNSEVVKPRQEKYLLHNGNVRQLNSVALDTHKKEMIRKRSAYPHLARTEYGYGKIYQTTLINKLICLLVNKLASLDPFGVGIEMEANKPNWYDALNGLPALFGSSVCETFELKRLILFIKQSLISTKIDRIYLTEEVLDFFFGIDKAIVEYFSITASEKDYLFWDKVCSLKESYRHKTRLGVSGRELELLSEDLQCMLSHAAEKVDLGIKRAFDAKTGIYFSYFINEVAEYDLLDKSFIRPRKFRQVCLPFFLESQVHALRLTNDLNEARNLCRAVRRSVLYDRRLKMYKVTSSLSAMPEEIGRCRVFTPGWLENESIWLHMEYKYILEMLKHGLYEEFYASFKDVMIPFQDPQRYGRSILENSSFIASSAFLDKKLHGNGFVARLSGSTVEFMHIWLLMNIGSQPFFLDPQGMLNLSFSPHLPSWLFTRKDKTYSFNFLSKVSVVYHNPKMKDTFGPEGVQIKKIVFYDNCGKRVDLNGNIIPPPYAEQVRLRQIKQIDFYLE